MRVIFGLLGLVLTLFVVLQLVKTQTATTAPAAVQPTVVERSDVNLPVLQGNPKQVQEQYQQALDDALKAGQQRLDAAEKP
jgi:hypothetical protein